MKVVYTGARCEIIEKKSKFIASIRSVSSEEEAVSFITEIKKEFHDARHNCSAFAIGSRNELTRCSDDGEPSQTAGKPMLDVLLHEEIHNAAVVVTRYFGGVLLGTGGLVRAYQSAVQEVIRQAEIIDRKKGSVLEIRSEYTDLGKLQYLLAQRQYYQLESEYSDTVKLNVLIPEEDISMIEMTLTEEFAGRSKSHWLDEVEFAVIDREIEIFKKN